MSAEVVPAALGYAVGAISSLAATLFLIRRNLVRAEGPSDVETYNGRVDSLLKDLTRMSPEIPTDFLLRYKSLMSRPSSIRVVSNGLLCGDTNECLYYATEGDPITWVPARLADRIPGGASEGVLTRSVVMIYLGKNSDTDSESNIYSFRVSDNKDQVLTALCGRFFELVNRWRIDHPHKSGRGCEVDSSAPMEVLEEVFRMNHDIAFSYVAHKDPMVSEAATRAALGMNNEEQQQ